MHNIYHTYYILVVSVYYAVVLRSVCQKCSYTWSVLIHFFVRHHMGLPERYECNIVNLNPIRGLLFPQTKAFALVADLISSQFMRPILPWISSHVYLNFSPVLFPLLRIIMIACNLWDLKIRIHDDRPRRSIRDIEALLLILIHVNFAQASHRRWWCWRWWILLVACQWVFGIS